MGMNANNDDGQLIAPHRPLFPFISVHFRLVLFAMQVTPKSLGRLDLLARETRAQRVANFCLDNGPRDCVIFTAC